MISYDVVILAAGQGKRMKAGENKQFIKLKSKPLILHTVNVFLQDSWCSSVTLVINPKEESRMNQLLASKSFSKPFQLVKGGAERQESVLRGLESLAYKSKELVFIHDGARPFVSIDSLHQLAEVTHKQKAALLAVPVTDTIKQRQGNKLTTLNRETLWAAQTPQAFNFELIYEAHQRAEAESFLGTDDASLVERMGENVAVVTGSYNNIKITTPEDLTKAQAYLDSFTK